MPWSRTALFTAFAAATVAGVCSLRSHAEPDGPHAEPGVISTVACYVALANDITLLLSPSESDVAASSPECVAQAALDEGRHKARARPATRDRLPKVPNGG